MARDLHGHNVCAEISPKALSRLNFQVKQSEKFGLEQFLRYTHEQGIAHRHAKPEDIFPKGIMTEVRV